MSKESLLASELREHIAELKKQSERHRRLFRALRYAVYALTACSTAFAGIALAFPSLHAEANIAVLLVSASISAVSAVEGLRKPGELWIHERGLYYDLRDLERDLRYHCADDSEAVPVDQLYGRMQSILASGRDRWSQHVATAQRRGTDFGRSGRGSAD